jgi:sodium/potassium-transporting ATPase subunit alpha
LTGESQAIKKSASMTDENPLETRNLAFYLSSCISGTGRGVVIKIGNETIIGRIAKLVSTTVTYFLLNIFFYYLFFKKE